MQQKIEAEELERIKLDGLTIDKVVCGEQQPESDHFIQHQDSRTGFVEDVHWREAKAWFSYQMKAAGATQLYIKYFDNDRNRNFDILIGGKRLTTIQLNGGKSNALQAEYIAIPSGFINSEKSEISIKAHDGSTTGKIVELRLLNK